MGIRPANIPSIHLSRYLGTYALTDGVTSEKHVKKPFASRPQMSSSCSSSCNQASLRAIAAVIELGHFGLIHAAYAVNIGALVDDVPS